VNAADGNRLIAGRKQDRVQTNCYPCISYLNIKLKILFALEGIIISLNDIVSDKNLNPGISVIFAAHEYARCSGCLALLGEKIIVSLFGM
jgi:hypothetical protein